jgi:hypothetical protein
MVDNTFAVDVDNETFTVTDAGTLVTTSVPVESSTSANVVEATFVNVPAVFVFVIVTVGYVNVVAPDLPTV